MKKFTYYLFASTLLFSSYAIAQETSGVSEDNEAPIDFLDLFDSSRTDKKEVITQTEFLINFGFNQALGEDNGIGEDYRFWGSGYFDFGLEFSTNLSKAVNTPRLAYGLSLRYSSLRINDDQTFFTQDNVTRLETFKGGEEIEKSIFRQVGFHAPIHLEFGKREVKEYDDGIKRYGNGSKFVFGIGGYLGYTFTTMQRTEFDREGRDVTNDLINDFEINNFNYGLSVYAGFEDMQLYASYGLNEIFDNSPVDQRYVTIGIRLR